MADRYFNHIVGCLESSIKTAEDGVDCRISAVTAQGAVDLLKEQQEKIERLQQIWIPVSERLPEEKETIFAKLKGTDKWRSAMFEKMSDDVRVVVVFSDGTRKVSHSHTVDGKWGCEMSPVERTVTHWMQNPELPKDGDRE